MALPDYIKRGTVSLFLAIIGGIIAMTAGWYGLQSSVADARAEIHHHAAKPIHDDAKAEVDKLVEKINRMEVEQRVQGTDIEYIKKGIEQIQKDIRGR